MIFSYVIQTNKNNHFLYFIRQGDFVLHFYLLHYLINTTQFLRLNLILHHLHQILIRPKIHPQKPNIHQEVVVLLQLSL